MILGGGRQKFFPETVVDPEGRYGGRRRDGKNLKNEWIKDKENRDIKNKYVWHKDDLLSVDTDETDYLLGNPHFIAI